MSGPARWQEWEGDRAAVNHYQVAENLHPERDELLRRIDALSEDNVRMILAYLSGYNPELVEEQVARCEAKVQVR